MQARLTAWGNSQGIRIPKEILAQTGIALNEVLDISATAKGSIVISKPFRHRSLEERAKAFGGELNLDGEFDWGEPVGNEVWQ